MTWGGAKILNDFFSWAEANMFVKQLLVSAGAECRLDFQSLYVNSPRFMAASPKHPLIAESLRDFLTWLLACAVLGFVQGLGALTGMIGFMCGYIGVYSV